MFDCAPLTIESLESLDTFKRVQLVPAEVEEGDRLQILKSSYRIVRVELVVGQVQLVKIDTDGDIFDMVDVLVGQIELLELLDILPCSLGGDDSRRQLHGERGGSGSWYPDSPGV